MKEALGENWNKNDVEMGQTFNKENAAKPLRDTFMLVLNSEVLNADSMGKFYSVSFQRSPFFIPRNDDQKWPHNHMTRTNFRPVSIHKQ